MQIAILGLGARGKLFATIAKREGIKIAAACDIDDEQRKRAKECFDVAEDKVFDDAEKFFNAGRLADALVISTLDETHYRYAMRAIELGYNILLEKPIALKEKDILDILHASEKKGVKVSVCHVLRYTPFYRKIKEIIDSGAIGRIMNINQTENVGYYHYAHSFVRGNWHNSKETCPMILAKCCHDFDLILWLSGKSCKSLSSFGELTYFKKENAPEDSAANCNDCIYKNTCAYSGIKIYTQYPKWVKVPCGCEENVENAMIQVRDKRTFYAKCVFRCDNDVVDHQYVNMELEDGVYANLTMQAFSSRVYRRTQVCGTLGEINGVLEDDEIMLSVFGEPDKTIKIEVNDSLSQHSGGDRLLFLDFVNLLEGNKSSAGLTSLEKSVESHIAAFRAEESRLCGGKTIELKK